MTIDLDKFDTILDLSDPDFARKFGETIGVKPGEPIEVMTPQFDRTDGVTSSVPLCDFRRMHELDPVTLKAIGCGKWDETLWLFPWEWYDHLPDGLPIVFIDGERGTFERGKTDDAKRFGMLAFGFRRDAP